VHSAPQAAGGMYGICLAQVIPTQHGQHDLDGGIAGGSVGVSRCGGTTVETSLAGVRLSEPLGSHLVLVTRVSSDDRDQFVVLVLDRSGVRRTYALESAAWAETAPLGRFRLVGSSLFQLGSTSAGAFVDRFDLEVK